MHMHVHMYGLLIGRLGAGVSVVRGRVLGSSPLASCACTVAGAVITPATLCYVNHALMGVVRVQECQQRQWEEGW